MDKKNPHYRKNVLDMLHRFQKLGPTFTLEVQ